MATVQISFQDNANNEASFRIYRGASATVTTSDTYIAEISLSSNTWSISGQNGTAHALTSSNTGDATTTGETFTMTYEEATGGDYYYGVCAHNSVGSSAVASSSTAVTVE
jgi:hypothetical protein